MKINRRYANGLDTLQGLARIPMFQVYFLLWAAVLGAILFIAGFLWAERTLRGSFDKVPPPLWLIGIGLADFAVFLPMAYIIFLAKELQKTKDRVEELARGKPSSDLETQP